MDSDSTTDVWEQLKGSLGDLRDSFTFSQDSSVLAMVVYLLMGGLLALYIRFLYRRCNASVSDSDSVARIFPLLTMVTIGVIAVVKSSLALSLGLVGALSIVRFRAAIKDPEELVYLFLCIGVGLALGAEQPLLAIALVVLTTLFVLGIHLTTGKSRRQSLLLTISGDSKRHFGDDESGVMPVVEELVGRYTLQRFDLEQDRGQVRIVLNQKGGQETTALISRLRERLPECEFSYVNLESTL
jgi:uncharacterized membrane protein YhiD involved in acid resistance|tara:strand:- start:7975 stop:8700 length:726 start_codon:yes stop_codon:yes gene_type:complete